MPDFWSDLPEAEIALRLTRSIPVATYVCKTAPGARVLRFGFLGGPWQQLTGLVPADLRNDPRLVFRLIHSHDQRNWRRAALRAVAGRKPLHWEGRLLVGEEIRWISVQCTPFALSDGGLAWEGVLINITARRRMEEQLRASERHWQEALDHIPTPILYARLIDRLDTFFVNRQFVANFGYTLADIQTSKDWLRRAYPDRDYRARVRLQWQKLVRRIAAAPGTVEQMETRVRCANGRGLDILAFAAVVENRLLISFIDISERKRAEARNHHLARHDRLTGLPNRMRFDERLAAVLSLAACQAERRLAMLFIDLDRFKQVNDVYGHRVGDLLLGAVGGRLRGLVREHDVPARLGGDELVVLIDQAGEAPQVMRVAWRILRALSRPYVIENMRLSISASIGVALFPEHGGDAATLMRRADTAMYVAKTEGGGRVVLWESEAAEQPAG